MTRLRPLPALSSAAFAPISRRPTKSASLDVVSHFASSSSTASLSEVAVTAAPVSYSSTPTSTTALSMGDGVIDWSDPGEAIAGGITLLYIAFSVFVGIRYIVRDGWRPPKL